jgi:hypothetical protein
MFSTTPDPWKLNSKPRVRQKFLEQSVVGIPVGGLVETDVDIDIYPLVI